MKPVAWGVISTAKIGLGRALPGMRKSAWCDLRAIASRNEASARKAADALGIPVAYGSYEALLADPAIEAIYNPLPNHLHVPLTLQAAAAGKHVLCEKPIALTATEAEQLRTAANRVLIMEAFMVRFHPQWLRARELLHEDRIGTLRVVQAFFGYANLDPVNIQEDTLWIDLGSLQIPWDHPFEAHDELTGATYVWHGPSPYVRLDPAVQVGHVLHLRPLRPVTT